MASWRCKKGVFSDLDCLPDKLTLVGLRRGLFSVVPVRQA
jgi:hypothetical protein